MDLLLYCANQDDVFLQVDAVLAEAVRDPKAEVFASLQNLARRLTQPMDRPAVAVFMVVEAGDILRILELGPLMDDIRVILILPRYDPDIAKTAHLLRPRYYTFADSDFRDLGAVATKMFHAPRSKEVPVLEDAP